MSGTILERSLNAVARRLYKLRVLRRQALCWVLLLVPAIVLAVTLPQLSGFVSTTMLVLLCTTIVGLALARWNVPAPTAIETARLVEKNRPELNDAVLTAVRADAVSRTQPNSSILNEWVIDEADHLARNSDWRSVVPGRQMLGWSLLSFLAFCFLITGVVAAGRWGREPTIPSQTLVASDLSGAQEVIGQTTLSVDPGDVEIERGAALTVIGRFGNVLPSDVMLEVASDDGAATFTMEPTVDEGVFAVRVNSVQQDSDYRVCFGNSLSEIAGVLTQDATGTIAAGSGVSQSYRISTYVRPELQKVDALVTPPAYTNKGPQLIEDTLRMTAVEGSTVELKLHLNKPVAIAELRTEGGEIVSLTHVESEGNSEPNAPEIVSAILEAFENQKFRVYLEDTDGRTAKDEAVIVLKVRRNQRPKIKVTFPGRDTNVSPLQEFSVEAQATDDFGFTDFGLMYSLTGGTPTEVSLQSASDKTGEVADLRKKIKIPHVIEMEKLGAAPDELLSYSFYVEDAASDGSVRRTYSDMMFAEVRRFEEIFRESQQQGQPQPQQQQQQEGSPAQKLMELQRQIMIATWNVQRSFDEYRNRPVKVQAITTDAVVVRDSQQEAITQLQEVKEEAASDPEMLKIAESVEQDMSKAVQSLSAFAENSSDSGLQDALLAEQSAFSGLMRMRAKEHEISRSQSKGKGKGKSSASQQQLNQLELDNERKRYESERQAQEQQAQNAEQKQQLQILNRLKELARRQEMLNERLKQLESELRAAQTQEEKDEIERELKRLREEQREMLRDVDELRETMDQQSPEQQQQNQETREQVDQARDRVQQASRAMEDGKLSEAIAEGTRAERQFEQLQEEFRQQTSNQFSEAMRDLREQTRQINEQQDEIARELSGQGQTDEGSENDKPARQRPSLRNDRDREDLQQKVAQQRDDLERVLEQAKKIVEEAEDSEPLLSRRLYDTIRDTRAKNPREALEATEILVSRGLWNQGQQTEQIARQGIDDLTKGIENAADAVLGSQAESLQRAQEEIEALADQLSSEIADATGQNPDDDQRQGQPGANGSPAQPNEGQPQAQGSESAEEGMQSPSRQNIQRAAAPLPSQQRDSESGDDRQPGQETQRGQQATGNGGENKPQPNDSQKTPGQPGEGQQPGDPNSESQDGKQSMQGNGEPEEGDSQQAGQQQDGQAGQPAQQGKGHTAGKGQGQRSQQGQQGSGGQAGSGQQSGQQQSNGQPGEQPGQAQQPGPQSSTGSPGFLMNGGREANAGGRGQNQGRPLTGDDFRDWSNRLREVEEILDDPELSQQVAQVRDRARSIRAEFRRHGTEPQWDLVKSKLLDEMTSLQKRIQQELAKMTSNRSMVPIDREPVPEEFDELVRRYYELLGQSRGEDE